MFCTKLHQSNGVEMPYNKAGKANRPTVAYGEKWKIIVPGKFNVGRPLTHNVRLPMRFTG